jgi:hypothetical protein
VRAHVRLVAATVVVAAVGLPADMAAAADGGGATSAVTATVTAGSVGSRSITLAVPVTMASALDSSTLSGSLAATVTEAARTGTNPWSVTASIGTLTSGTDTLANTNMTISNRAVVKTAGGGTATGTSGSQVVDAARTLFTNTGQDASTVYTGTYASTSDWTLSLPNASKTGVYTGTITLTLVQ